MDQCNIFIEPLSVQPIVRNPDSSFNFTHEQKHIKSLHLRSVNRQIDSFLFEKNHVQLHSAKQDTTMDEHY